MNTVAAAEHAGHAAHDIPADEYFGKVTLGKIGMWIFLLSDALSFAGLLLAYGILRGGSSQWWNKAVEPDFGINFTAGLTFLLICSSVTMVMAYAAAVEGNRRQLCFYLALTALGGILFLCGQFQEYFGLKTHPVLIAILLAGGVCFVLAADAAGGEKRGRAKVFLLLMAVAFAAFVWAQAQPELLGERHLGLTKRGLIFGPGGTARAWSFFVITSFHGFHVFSGVTYLTVMLIRSALGKYDHGNSNHVELVGLFWHFVDLIWIVVFTLVYLFPV